MNIGRRGPQYVAEVQGSTFAVYCLLIAVKGKREGVNEQPAQGYPVCGTRAFSKS